MPDQPLVQLQAVNKDYQMGDVTVHALRDLAPLTVTEQGVVIAINATLLNLRLFLAPTRSPGP